LTRYLRIDKLELPGGEQRNNPGFRRSAGTERISEHGDGVSHEEKIAKRTANLGEQFSEPFTLENGIGKNLAWLGSEMKE